MANLSSIGEARDALVAVAERSKTNDFVKQLAKDGTILQVVVQLENAKTMSAASKALSESIDRFTEASERGTNELAKWTKSSRL